MLNPNHPDIVLLERVAARLDPLLGDLVLVGGCSTVLLITDPAAPPPSGTFDIDLVVEAATYLEYDRYTTELRKLGFHQTPGTEEPICRFHCGRLIVDLMPHGLEVLGFGNRWFQAAMDTSEELTLPSGRNMRHTCAPCFLATKLEAFQGRGADDFWGSKDMEDILAVIDGRPELVDECRSARSDVRGFLAEQFGSLLQDPGFVDCLEGIIPGGAQEHGRIPILKGRIAALADL